MELHRLYLYKLVFFPTTGQSKHTPWTYHFYAASLEYAEQGRALLEARGDARDITLHACPEGDRPYKPITEHDEPLLLFWNPQRPDQIPEEPDDGEPCEGGSVF